MDQMHWDGYFFVTRIKNTKVHVIDTLETSPETEILRDELVRLGSKTYLTANFRLVTVQDKNGRVFQFITNRMDVSSKKSLICITLVGKSNCFQAHQTTHDH